MVEEEKLDHITGQKESEIPIGEASFKPTQDVYFILTKNWSFDSKREDTGLHVLGIFFDGLFAREAMDKIVLEDGWKPSDIQSGSPDEIIIERQIRGSFSICEYKIWQKEVSYNVDC